MGLFWAISAVAGTLAASTLAPIQCGDHWRAAAIEQGQLHVYSFQALHGQHVRFETFQDPGWPRPVNTRVQLVHAASREVIASNNDKAFGDVFSKLEACIPQDGCYEVLVDVPSGSWPGAYEASFECTAAFRHRDDCADSGEFTCGVLSYDNAARCLTDDFDPGVAGCTGFAATGGDAVLGLRVEPGWSLDVTLQSSADAVLYLVGDCQDIPGTCVGGADQGQAGEPERLRHHFYEAGFWYLVLDHHGGGQGQLSLTGELSCETVAVQEATWTRIRTLYRE